MIEIEGFVVGWFSALGNIWQLQSGRRILFVTFTIDSVFANEKTKGIVRLFMTLDSFNFVHRKITGQPFFLFKKNYIFYHRIYRINYVLYYRFLTSGTCNTKDCKLSHDLKVGKIPACRFFNEGSCSREACKYLHVLTNSKKKLKQCVSFFSFNICSVYAILFSVIIN